MKTLNNNQKEQTFPEKENGSGTTQCMLYRITTILLLTCISRFAWGQTTQTREDILQTKNLKIRSIQRSLTQYSEWAASPEGEIVANDSNDLFCLFDTSGRLVREYFNTGTEFLRKISYDSKGNISDETWLYSKLQAYPDNTKPVSDTDYSGIWKTVSYTYDPTGRLVSSLESNGDKTVYQYNDSGYLVSKLTTQPSGYINAFTLNKWGYGVHSGKLIYAVSNYVTRTIIYEYKYSDRKLIERKIIYDDGKTSTTYYNENEKEKYEELFNGSGKLVAKFVYTHTQFGPGKIISYRLPAYKDPGETRTDQLRISEEEIYKYETW